jgi:hypothetical protein
MLQRKEMPGETRRLVEEAAQLLGDGREIEARALVEKAQAIASIGGHPSGGHTGAAAVVAVAPAPITNGAPAPSLEEAGLQQFAAKLSAGITAALTNALMDVQRYAAEEARKLARAVEARVDKIAGEIRALRETDEQLDRRISAHDERLAAIDQAGVGFTAGLAGLNERIDHQTDLLRGMQQRQAHRAAVLHEALGNIAKLREQLIAEAEPNV